MPRARRFSQKNRDGHAQWDFFRFWIVAIRSPNPDSAAGWFRPPRLPSTCVSARRTRSRVFNAPLTKVIGITKSAPDDWSLTTLGWIFSLAIVFLGLSAAFAGKWLEKVGPRRTMFTAALLLRRRLSRFGARRVSASDLAALSRLWRDRRHRARARLRVAGVDADPLVPGPPRHGDRHGDHGLRRRRDDRRARFRSR